MFKYTDSEILHSTQGSRGRMVEKMKGKMEGSSMSPSKNRQDLTMDVGASRII